MAQFGDDNFDFFTAQLNMATNQYFQQGDGYVDSNNWGAPQISNTATTVYFRVNNIGVDLYNWDLSQMQGMAMDQYPRMHNTDSNMNTCGAPLMPATTTNVHFQTYNIQQNAKFEPVRPVSANYTHLFGAFSNQRELNKQTTQAAPAFQQDDDVQIIGSTFGRFNPILIDEDEHLANCVEKASDGAFVEVNLTRTYSTQPDVLQAIPETTTLQTDLLQAIDPTDPKLLAKKKPKCYRWLKEATGNENYANWWSYNTRFGAKHPNSTSSSGYTTKTWKQVEKESNTRAARPKMIEKSKSTKRNNEQLKSATQLYLQSLEAEELKRDDDTHDPKLAAELEAALDADAESDE